MEMRFFHVADQVKLGNFNVAWQGQENLAHYFTRHFDAKHHQAVYMPMVLTHGLFAYATTSSISSRHAERVC